VIHPFLGILTLRDELMAEGTVRMLDDHPTVPAAVVVMGRAHVSGYARILVERYGFARDLPEIRP
jgi:pheromone shutdown protein TraB